MFSKISRYRKLVDIVTDDPRGRSLASKALRIIDDIEGVVEHTIEESDRLDHLGYKYYKQSRHWWRVCDANVEHFSPFEMLGKTPLKRCSITILGDEDVHPYPWNALKAVITAMLGVEDVQPHESTQRVQVNRSVGSETVLVEADEFSRTVEVYFNSHLVTHMEIADELRAHGYTIAEPELIGQIGKTLLIPRAPSV